VEDVRRDVVGSAVRAIDDDAHALEVALVGERRLAELDVASAGILAPPHLAELRGRVALYRLVHLGLDRRLDRVVELEAVAREELDAVVRIRVVRGADDHARRKPERAREIGNGRRRQRPGHVHVDAGRREPGLEGRLDHVARYARVLADEHGGMRA
jgi:hypothetical protein